MQLWPEVRSWRAAPKLPIISDWSVLLLKLSSPAAVRISRALEEFEAFPRTQNSQSNKSNGPAFILKPRNSTRIYRWRTARLAKKNYTRLLAQGMDIEGVFAEQTEATNHEIAWKRGLHARPEACALSLHKLEVMQMHGSRLTVSTWASMRF